MQLAESELRVDTAENSSFKPAGTNVVSRTNDWFAS